MYQVKFNRNTER